MARKQIPKSIRFEVFKRDKFTCQYCGVSAPEAILEVDHIKPVSRGGTNDVMNLVTACRACNRGKTNRELTDNATVKVQKKLLDDMQERREQLEMMVKWRELLEEETESEIDMVNNFLRRNTDYTLNENGRATFRKLIRRFGFYEVYTSVEIAIDRYYKWTESSWENAINKVGGICYNRKKARENDA